MNTKIGIFHGDLHMNNATLFQLNRIIYEGKSYISKPHICYILAKDEVYILPHTGVFSTIIDFSRAIFGNLEKLVHEFGQLYAERYFKEQELRVMQLLYYYFPKIMMKHHDKIEILLRSNFPLMFKILSSLDAYVICSNLKMLFQVDDAFKLGKIKIGAGIGKFLMNIIVLAENITLDNLQKAIDGTLKTVDDLEWPNLTLLRDVFVEFRQTKDTKLDKDITIADVFNYTNELKYDIDDFSTWGPLLSLDKIIELYKKHGLPMKDFDEWLHYKNLDETDKLEKLASKYEHQERNILKFEPWMLL